MTSIHDKEHHSTQLDDSARPQPETRPGNVEQAGVTHYAYDPETYEILCRPGQRLSQKKAQRLQELNLDLHVVAFVERFSA